MCGREGGTPSPQTLQIQVEVGVGRSRQLRRAEKVNERGGEGGGWSPNHDLVEGVGMELAGRWPWGRARHRWDRGAAPASLRTQTEPGRQIGGGSGGGALGC